MKDRPFEVGFREQASNHPKRHWSKACVVTVGEKAGDTCQEWITKTSGSDPLMTGRKGAGRHQERVSLLGQGWGVPDDGPTGVRHEGGVTAGQSGEAHVLPIQDDNLTAEVPLRRSILQSTLQSTLRQEYRSTGEHN